MPTKNISLDNRVKFNDVVSIYCANMRQPYHQICIVQNHFEEFLKN